MEARLIKRHEQLVQSHMCVGGTVSAGVKSTLSKEQSFSQTQAAWRFFNNESCTLVDLFEPLLEAGYELSRQESDNYSLMVHDWSHLGYNRHMSKEDTYNTFKKCVGYNLQSSLLMSDNHGGPLSLLAMNLKTKTKLISSYGTPSRDLTNLEELAHRIDWLEQLPLKNPCVHIIDKEGDSVAFYRALKDKNWLIRVKGRNTISFEKKSISIEKCAAGLEYTESRKVEHKGEAATQLISETKIAITRPAYPKRKDASSKRVQVDGEPVHGRLIVSKIVDASGKELSVWYLFSNLEDVSAATLALWYYWRWSIESYFKLLKTAGMQLESWQQKTPMAMSRRLAVASMACVCVWRIANKKGAEAGELRTLLVRLSGRQMKWKVEFTYNALFAGLWTLINMQSLLDEIGVDKIKVLIDEVQRSTAFV